jgi:protein tyrosine kinase modulator
MQDLVKLVLTELHSAWRFRWWGAALAWLAFAGGFAWVVWQPNVYEATSRVYVDTSSVLRPILNKQIIPVDVGTELNYVTEALLGRKQLERVAQQTGLDVGATTPAQHDAVLDQLHSKIRIGATGRTRTTPDNLYTIRYRHSNRETAIAVVDTLLNTLVEDTLGANRKGADTAEEFLDARIQEYETRLQQSERALAEFKKRNADQLPGAEGGYFARIQQESAALDEAKKTLRLAQLKRDRLVEQLKSESPVIAANTPAAQPPPNSLDARIRDYHQQLDKLLLDYTDKHPDVIAVREALSRLEAQRAEELKALGVNNPDQEISSLDANPVHQAVQIAINQADAEIAPLQADVDDRTSKLAELRSQMDKVPEVEAELARLNRDYDVIHEQYQALVRSRETQNLSRKAEDTDQVDFRIITPPSADYDPVAPDRLRLLGMVFIASLMAGAALCWLLAQMRPVFAGIGTLRDISGLPVLGAVSHAWAARHQLERRMAVLSFAGVMGALFAVFVAAVALEVAGPGVHALVRFV